MKYFAGLSVPGVVGGGARAGAVQPLSGVLPPGLSGPAD